MTFGERMGWLRIGVGVSMIAMPRAILTISGRELPTSTAVLLLQTIGIRDVALGLGVVSSSRRSQEDLHRLTRIALVSDSMDVAAGLLSRRSIGVRDSTAAAAVALLAVLGDVHALRSLGANSTTS